MANMRWIYFRWLYPADKMTGLPESIVVDALNSWLKAISEHPDEDVLITMGREGWNIEALDGSAAQAREDDNVSRS